MTPEGKVKAEYRKWLRAKGAYVFSPTATGYGMQGVDDYVCYRGRFIAIEAKRPDKPAQLTKRQQQTLLSVSAAGGVTIVARSLGEVVSYIQMLDEHLAKQ